MKRKFLLLALITVLMFSSVSTAKGAHADSDFSFDTSNVLEDLQSSTVDGNPFDIREFPFDATAPSPYILSVVEWCYSQDKTKQNDFALYLYIYNPQGIDFDVETVQNKVQIAVKYKINVDTLDLEPIDYQKFSLVFCNMSEESDYKGLFYKFRIEDQAGSDGKKIVERVRSSDRQYDISGVELLTKGMTTATEYHVGASYTFKGYAKGYGPDAEADSTLSCTVKELETISLDVRNTFFRTASSISGAGYQNQLDSVYFAVPNYLLEKYGKLQRIKAEWYEYKTKEVVVTSNQEFFLRMISYVGTDVSNVNSSRFVPYYLEANPRTIVTGTTPKYFADWGWFISKQTNPTTFDRLCTRLYYMFNTDDIQNYDPYSTESATGGITGNALSKYIYNYKKTFENGTLPIKKSTISADLFLSYVDEGRTMGYNVRDFDADIDIHQMLSYSEGNPSFWDKVKDYGFWNTIFGDLPQIDDSYKSIAPIKRIVNDDFKETTVSTAKHLLIRQEEVGALKEYYNQVSDSDSTMFLFRYATTEYLSRWLNIFTASESSGYAQHPWINSSVTGQAYYSQQSVFLDFDILQLTFARDGKERVIPVVSSPKDIFNDVTPPTPQPDDNALGRIWQQILDWFKWLFGLDIPWWAWLIVAVVALAILIAILNPFWSVFKTIFKIVGYIIWYALLGATFPIWLPFYLVYKKRQDSA